MMVEISPQIPDFLTILVLHSVLFSLEHYIPIAVNSDTQKTGVFSSLPQFPPLPIAPPRPPPSLTFLVYPLGIWVCSPRYRAISLFLRTSLNHIVWVYHVLINRCAMDGHLVSNFLHFLYSLIQQIIIKLPLYSRRYRYVNRRGPCPHGEQSLVRKTDLFWSLCRTQWACTMYLPHVISAALLTCMNIVTRLLFAQVLISP